MKWRRVNWPTITFKHAATYVRVNQMARTGATAAPWMLASATMRHGGHLRCNRPVKDELGVDRSGNTYKDPRLPRKTEKTVKCYNCRKYAWIARTKPAIFATMYGGSQLLGLGE